MIQNVKLEIEIRLNFTFCIIVESCSTSYFTESVHKLENKKGF